MHLSKVSSISCLPPPRREHRFPVSVISMTSLLFQDSNPFASLVFYWEPLNRQVSEHLQDNFLWTVWAGVNL